MIRIATLLAVAVLAGGVSGCSFERDDDDDDDAATAALRTDIDELKAREAIRALFADYGRTLDDRDFKAFGRLWARDADFVGGGNSGAAHGPDDIAAALERAITANATGANLHVFSNEKIEVHGEQATATSRGAFFGQDAAGRPAALIYATYRDELVVEDGAWKFKRRQIVGDIPGPPNGTAR